MDAADLVPRPARAAPGRHRRRDRADRDQQDRRELRHRPGHRHGVSLEKGPGHYPGDRLPGLGQTVAIAGHRTTYLAPFRHIDSLSPGDRIVLKMPYAQFTYVVQYHKIVPADRAVGDRQRRLRPARAVGLQPALQRRAADHRVRATAGGAADHGDRGGVTAPARRRRAPQRRARCRCPRGWARSQGRKPVAHCIAGLRGSLRRALSGGQPDHGHITPENGSERVFRRVGSRPDRARRAACRCGWGLPWMRIARRWPT